VHATSMPLDACESPARSCARSAERDELYRIDKASMVLIVAEPQATVQAFYVPHRSGGLSLTDGALVFRSSDWISGADSAEFSCAKAPNVVTRSMECHKRNMTFSYFCPVLGKQETASYFDAGRTGNEEELKTKSGFPVIASNLHTNNESSHTP